MFKELERIGKNKIPHFNERELEQPAAGIITLPLSPLAVIGCLGTL
jgi:hypothetical protein